MQSLDQNVAVLGTVVNGKGGVGLVQQQHLVALVNDTGQTLLGDVTQLTAHITEGEEQVTVKVVGKDLTSLLVDDGPGLFGTDGHVHHG